MPKHIIIFSSLIIATSSSLSYSDTIPKVNYKNAFEFYCVLRAGIGISYLYNFSDKLNLNVTLGYDLVPRLPDVSSVKSIINQNEYFAGIGLQNRITRFWIMDFSILYLLRERIGYYKYIDNTISSQVIDARYYATEIILVPKVQVHFLRRMFASLNIGLALETTSVKKNNYPPKQFLGYYAMPILALGCEI
jgi:hypothetical protein